MESVGFPISPVKYSVLLSPVNFQVESFPLYLDTPPRLVEDERVEICTGAFITLTATAGILVIGKETQKVIILMETWAPQMLS